MRKYTIKTKKYRTIFCSYNPNGILLTFFILFFYRYNYCLNPEKRHNNKKLLTRNELNTCSHGYRYEYSARK